MERAKQLGKIDARCILETAGHLIDHASRVTYELRGVAVAIHLNGVDSCQRLCDSLGDLRHDIDVCNQRIKEAKRTFETEQQAIS